MSVASVSVFWSGAFFFVSIFVSITVPVLYYRAAMFGGLPHHKSMKFETRSGGAAEPKLLCAPPERRIKTYCTLATLHTLLICIWDKFKVLLTYDNSSFLAF